MSFTGVKDLDLKILSKLNDRDLMNACLVNKSLYKACKTESFWKDRYITKFRTDFKLEESWKKSYLENIIHTEKFDLSFLSYIYWSPKGFDYSYYIPYKNINFGKIKLSEAPKNILINLYFLNLGDVDIILNEFKLDVKNLTPFKYFNLVSEKLKNTWASEYYIGDYKFYWNPDKNKYELKPDIRNI